MGHCLKISNGESLMGQKCTHCGEWTYDHLCKKEVKIIEVENETKE